MSLPDNIDELTTSDIKLLLDAVRIAAQDPRYMNDPQTSLRLGWILGMLYREVETRQAQRN